MKGFLWKMFTCEVLNCGDQRDFGGEHTQDFPFFGIFFVTFSIPQHLNLFCLIGQTEGILLKAGMPHQHSAPLEIMVLDCLCLGELKRVGIPVKTIFTSKAFNCATLSIDILSGSEHCTFRQILPVSRQLISSGFVKINCRCQVAQNCHDLLWALLVCGEKSTNTDNNRL